MSYPMMVLFERLSPIERAVFVLREVFDFSYPEIASMVDKSIVHCRKIFSRATKHLQCRNDCKVITEAQYAATAGQFMHGISTGDFDGFFRSIAPDVQMISDRGGKTKAAIYPVYGVHKVTQLLQGLYRKGLYYRRWIGKNNSLIDRQRWFKR